MSSNKQILVIVMSIIVCINGHSLRKKRSEPNAPNDYQRFMFDKTAEAMKVAGVEEKEDKHFDLMGTEIILDDNPRIGLPEDKKDPQTRRKRQAETDNMNGQQDQNTKEIHGMFQEMWQTMIEGGKKIIKKVADMIDRDGSQQQPGQEPEKTY